MKKANDLLSETEQNYSNMLEQGSKFIDIITAQNLNNDELFLFDDDVASRHKDFEKSISLSYEDLHTPMSL